MPHFQHASWICSAGDLSGLPPEGGAEVAFVGRSNSGKSSAINAITGRRQLAFVSKTPGRTQTINFFNSGHGGYLVDLPGYGYAAVSARQSREWGKLVGAYLQSRSSLRGLVLVMDVRHPFTEQDCRLLEWAAPLHRPVLILLTKSDKLSRAQLLRTLEVGRTTLTAANYALAAIQLFSATSGLGVPAARTVITGWLTKGKRAKKSPG